MIYLYIYIVFYSKLKPYVIFLKKNVIDIIWITNLSNNYYFNHMKSNFFLLHTHNNVQTTSFLKTIKAKKKC